MPRRAATLALLCGLLTAIGSEAARSQEQIVLVKSSTPGQPIKLLSAPHTGKAICLIEDEMPVSFIKRANHGPHKYAKVLVQDGECAGEEGYVAWTTLDPKPE